MMNRRRLIILVTIFMVSFLVVWALVWRSSAALQVSSYPSDAKITFNGKTYKSGQIIKSHPQKFTVTISREGFRSQTKEVTIGYRESKDIKVNLLFEDLSSKKPLNLKPQDIASQDGARMAQVSLALTELNPVIVELPLPYIGENFRIDFGDSQQPNAPPGKLALYISPSNDSAKQAALGWLSNQEADPSKLEIIYGSPPD